MRNLLAALIAMVGVFAAGEAAQASVQIRIDLSSQRMSVSSTSGHYVWAVSSARSGYATPRGSYRPQRLEAMHYSRKYHMSPMPHSIFFNGGYAIHGTYSTSELGRPASHGCIRLSPGNAAALYRMVKAEGARISISGVPPHSTRFASETHHRRRHHATAVAARYRAAAPLAYTTRDYAPSLRTWLRDPAR